MPRLERKSLSEELAQAITDEIAAGVWTDRLPGYRMLGKRYQVSRPTCESAMELLEANGIIAPATPGKMRSILRNKAKKQASAILHLLIIIDSQHPPTPLDAELVAQIENFWKIDGGEVTRVECDMMRNSKPRYQLEKWVKTIGADCLLFETIAQDWVIPAEEIGLPCFALGGFMKQSKGVISGCFFSIIQCIEKLLVDALELGHRRILLVTSRATPKDDMSASIHKATAPILTRDWDGEDAIFTLKIPDINNPSDWYDWWQKTILTEQPSLVMLDSVYQGLSLNDFCLDKGIRMPQDMSMIILEDAEFLAWMTPTPTRYRYQKEEAFRHFVTWVKCGFSRSSFKPLCADLVAGGKTLAYAPKKTTS